MALVRHLCDSSQKFNKRALGFFFLHNSIYLKFRIEKNIDNYIIQRLYIRNLKLSNSVDLVRIKDKIKLIILKINRALMKLEFLVYI